MAYTKTIWKDFPSEDTQITSENLQNIEDGIEALDTAFSGGWNLIENVTFALSIDDANQCIVTTSEDLRNILSVGMKVKFTQSSAIKYGIIVAITSSQLTLFLGTDYSINSSAISDTYFSMLKAPYGFPNNPTKWSVVANYTDSTAQNVPVVGTWYNLGTRKIKIPIGCWNVEYNTDCFAVTGTSERLDIEATLSTGNNNSSDNSLKARNIFESVSLNGANFSRKTVLTLTTATDYYLNYRYLNGTGVSLLGSDGGLAGTTTVIRAVSAYL